MEELNSVKFLKLVKDLGYDICKADPISLHPHLNGKQDHIIAIAILLLQLLKEFSNIHKYTEIMVILKTNGIVKNGSSSLISIYSLLFSSGRYCPHN